MRQVSTLPIPVKHALRKWGQDIKKARLRRRITMKLMAERARISRTTLTKVEKGDPTVGLGTYATVIFILGLIPNFTKLFDITEDELGLALDEERLPKRIRIPKTRGIYDE